MKTIKKSKFTLEKFEIAKLINIKSIVGGTSGNLNTLTGTDTDTISTEKCLDPEA